MFSTISILAILVVLGAAGLHWLVYPCSDKRDWSPRGFVRLVVHVLTMFFIEQKLNFIGRVKHLAYLVLCLCFLVLFVTGFGTRLLYGHELTGWVLMIHATFAPVFAVCAALAVLGWAQQCRLTADDWQWVIRLVCLRWRGLLENSPLGWKLTFWLGAALVIPVALSMVGSMYPIFGTHGQEVLFELHRYAALVLVLGAIVHVYLVMRAKFKADA